MGLPHTPPKPDRFALLDEVLQVREVLRKLEEDEPSGNTGSLPLTESVTCYGQDKPDNDASESPGDRNHE